MLTTVQDFGRDGHGALGVPSGGAADPLSFRLGNRLVGNHDNAPALEMTLTGGAFLFDHDATIVLAGGDLAASIEPSDTHTPPTPPTSAPRPITPWSAVPVHPGDRLRTGPISRGVRAYLCIAGGLAVPSVLGSASTHLAGGFGGFHGRALRAGDQLGFHTAPPRRVPAALSDHARTLARESLDRRTLRAFPGPHTAQFDSSSLFWSSPFTVTTHSDRVGLRLEGPAVPSRAAGRMRSEGMPCGAVQVPENGQPIILMVDRPTTGGYPVIACIATADLPTLGQLRPRDTVRFQPVTLAEARELFHERERRLLTVPRATEIS